MKTKAELREELKRARAELSPEEHAKSSQAICERLKTCIDWQTVKAVHYYEPIARLHEVDINPFTSFLQDTYPDMQCYTSRLIDGSWQIINLEDGKPAEGVVFQAIIVPMLGFDGYRQRIGYGGGYYDRFLSTQLNAKKIGVCLELGRLNNIPTEAYDIPLDIIVAESGVS